MSNFGDAGFGIASTVNTTTTPTTSYTGTGEQNDYPEVMVSCFSDDQDGTLYFDFSVNGTDWRTFPSDGFSVSAGIHEFHTAVKGPRYFRARFVASVSPTTFQLYSYFGMFSKTSTPLNQSFGLDADASIVQSLPDWMPISRGKATGISSIKKFGRNPSVGTSYVPITDYNRERFWRD